MDPAACNPNWLTFSLSNNSLFQPLSTTAGAMDGVTEDHYLPVLGDGRPKLEDFLGGAGYAPDAVGVQFDGGSQVTNIPAEVELKTRILGAFDTEKQLVAAPKKSAVESFGHRTSIFRGVTRHRWTGRYEAHLWDNSCRREGQSRKGRQVYLGGYDKEEKAARAYDLAALKYWGPTTTTNFPVTDYHRELEEMKHMTRQEFVASLRRRSSGFSRGASMYRGVTRHHQHGRWQARIGRVAGNKDLYLGTFSTQEEAAEAYDIAAIKFRGLNAVTNFDMNRYDVVSIASSNIPAKSQPDNNKAVAAIPMLDFESPVKQDHHSSLWAALGYQNPSNGQSSEAMGLEESLCFKGNHEEGFYKYNAGGSSYYPEQVHDDGGTSSETRDDAGNWMVAAAPIFGME